MDVDDHAPNEFFVSSPDDDVMLSALNDEGLDACFSDCGPQRCTSLYLKGSLEDSEKEVVADAIAAAYVEANPGVTAEDLFVNITNIENKLQDEEG